MLGSFLRKGILPVAGSYTQLKTVKLPNAIFGKFYILVGTDFSNLVYEHLGENDNTMASKVG